MRRWLAAASLLLALAAAAIAWGADLWLWVTTVPEPLAASRQGVIAIGGFQDFPWDQAVGEHRVHRWRRNAQGLPMRHGPFWIRYSIDGPVYLTGRYENDRLLWLTQRSQAGVIEAQLRFEGWEVIEHRSAPPWFEE